MDWESFAPSSLEYPEEVLRKAIAGFGKASGNLCDLALKELDGTSRILSGLSTDFQFDLKLVSPFLPRYRFTVLKLGYNVKMYPVQLIVDIDILRELLPDERVDEKTIIQMEDEGQLTEYSEKIFRSSKFTESVTGLMKIALRDVPKAAKPKT